MKNHKWKKILAIVTTVISSIYGINIYTGNQNDLPTIHEQISTVPNHNEIILQFGKTYNLQDGYKVEITIDSFNRKRVVFTPGETSHDR